MGKISIVTKNALLNHVFNSAYPNLTSQCYIGLSTTDPITSGVTEPQGDGYARIAINFNAPVAREVLQTSGVLSFPEVIDTAGGDWGSITHYAIYTTQTSGVLLAYGAFAESFNPVLGNTPTIPGSTVGVSIDATTGGATPGAGWSDITVTNMLNMVFRNIAWTQPSLFIGLTLSAGGLLTDSTLEANITECTGSGYARIPVTAWNPAGLSSTTTCTVNNTNVITLGPPTANDWEEFSSLGLFTALTGGDLIAYDNSNVADQTPTTVDTIQVAAGAANFSLN